MASAAVDRDIAADLELLVPPRLEYKSSSEPELRRHGAGGYKGFPPGVTVDELVLYRRRRPPSHLRPQDNLHPEQGTLKAIKSEYRRRFLSYPFQKSDSREKERRLRVRPMDALKVEGDTFFTPEYRDIFVDLPRQRPHPHRPYNQLRVLQDVPMEMMTEKSAKYVEYTSPKHALLTRKSTSLRNEGEFMETQSELHAKFVNFQGAKRAELTRRPTTLKMEGDMDIISEKREKFIDFGSPSKRMIIRRQSNLRLEGEMHTLTEKNDKYIKYPSPKKAPLRRRPTNLRLEGEIEKLTESNSKYINYGPMKRPDLMKRLTNLHLEGEVEYLPEYKSICMDFPRERPVVKRPASNIRTGGVFQNTTEKRSQYSNNSSLNERPDPQRRPPTFHLEDPFRTNPEYKEGDLAREQSKYNKQDEDTSKGADTCPNYVQFSDSQKPIVLRRHANFNVEGELFFLDQRESFRDMHAVKSTLPPRSSELSARVEQPMSEESAPLVQAESSAQTEPEPISVSEPAPPRRRPQARPKNSEVYKAFQVLDKERPDKVVTFNLIGQRPRTRSVSQCSKDLATMRDPSPSYRMHVSNVDDNRRQSMSLAMNCQENDNQQAFVVLNDDNCNWNNNKNNIRKRNVDVNSKKLPVCRSNLLDIPRGKGQSHQMNHINWMPPWYDAPTSI